MQESQKVSSLAGLLTFRERTYRFLLNEAGAASNDKQAGQWTMNLGTGTNTGAYLIVANDPSVVTAVNSVPDTEQAPYTPEAANAVVTDGQLNAAAHAQFPRIIEAALGRPLQTT